MMKLSEVLYGVALVGVKGRMDLTISSVEIDSRATKKDSLFVAIDGEDLDGHEFVEDAIANGATCILLEKLPLEELYEDVTYIQVENTRLSAAQVGANFYHHPSKELQLIGITGTNGKTTIATLGHQLFTRLGVKAGLLSTIETKIGDRVFESSLTTPDSITVQKLIREMVDEGCEIAFMEVSSHAIVQHRISGLQFAGGVFTNITRDHLDYHKTFKDYLKAKQLFFTQLPKSAFALYNTDDRNGGVMVQNSKARKVSYAMKSLATLKVNLLENSLDGLLLNIDEHDVYTQLTGSFNAINLLAVYGVAKQLGFDNLKVLEQLSILQGAKGRFQKVVSEGRVVGIIDYAHTPNALEEVLLTLESSRTGTEQLLTVVGCGGNRDKGKRPIMAAVAVEYSTKVIFTSDNPRNEHPLLIIEDMSAGVTITKRSKVMQITDRKEAIKTAVSMAGSGDIVLIAGKGHETYQEVAGKKIPFDDKEVLVNAFKELKK